MNEENFKQLPGLEAGVLMPGTFDSDLMDIIKRQLDIIERKDSLLERAFTIIEAKMSTPITPPTTVIGSKPHPSPSGTGAQLEYQRPVITCVDDLNKHMSGTCDCQGKATHVTRIQEQSVNRY
jgi:hypothetical protein